MVSFTFLLVLLSPILVDHYLYCINPLLTQMHISLPSYQAQFMSRTTYLTMHTLLNPHTYLNVILHHSLTCKYKTTIDWVHTCISYCYLCIPCIYYMCINSYKKKWGMVVIWGYSLHYRVWLLFGSMAISFSEYGLHLGVW